MGVRDNWELPGYLEWMPREPIQAGVPSPEVDKSPIYAPVVAAGPPNADTADQPKRSLAELVQNHLTGLRHSYAAQGWETFQSGDYQAALRKFALAERASLDLPEERAYYKLIMVYGGVAAGQYSQVANSIAFLLERDRKTGRLLYPGVFNRIFDENNVKNIGELYDKPGTDRPGGYQNPAYRTHNQAVDAAFGQNNSDAGLRAIMAVVEWGRGRRAEAIFVASRISDARYSSLGPVLQEAERQRRSGDPSQAAPETAPAAATGTRPAF